MLRWTVAATPRDTLVAMTADSGIIAAVKVYADRSQRPDAYVFDGDNHSISAYAISDRTITLRVPLAQLGDVRTLHASTERVGGARADDGPTLRL